MSIQLVTYANQTVTPTNDAIIYEKAVDQNGIFYGCNVTVTSNTVNITGGYGLVCGREFVVNSESITVTLAPSGTLQGRLYVRLDLADADAPIQLLTATGNTLPPLEQDSDVNYTNGTYEMELATFTVGVSALSDCVETFETIVGTKPYADYVIEEGTDANGWYIRKWYSGAMEATTIINNPTIGAASQMSGVYRMLISVPNKPTFTTVRHISVSGQNGGAWVSATINSSGIPEVYLLRVSGTVSALGNLSVYLNGTWK